MPTLREYVATTLNQSQILRDLGLPENAIFQADTVDSVLIRPFGVIRWLDEQPGMKDVRRRPFDLWFYDEHGTYDRIDALGAAAKLILKPEDPLPVEIKGGWLLEIRDGIRGRDLIDEGYDALAVSWRFVAVASGE